MSFMTDQAKKYLSLLLFFGLMIAHATGQNKNLAKYFDEKRWNELFPNRFDLSSYGGQAKRKGSKKDFFSLKNFIEAAQAFPQFLSGNDAILQKRELCAFLASIAYETSGGWDDAPGGYYRWGLYFTQEQGCEKGCPQYVDTTKKIYPAQPGQSYHGRGPLQLSWNYNYGQFSEVYFKTKERLLTDPSLVNNDAVVSFASAIWFWVTPQIPKPSCHDIMYGNWQPSARDIAGGRLPGFGAVVNIINGGIECGKTSADTKYRYEYYRYFCRYIKVDPGPNVECTTQKPFGQ
jgi:hypothetical protein